MSDRQVNAESTHCPHRNCNNKRGYHSALFRDIAGAGRMAERMGVVILQCESNPRHRYAIKVNKE